MTVYEVHISATSGLVEEPHVVTTEDGMGSRTQQSLFLRTPDIELALHVADVADRTARRSDDRKPWIRCVETAEVG